MKVEMIKNSAKLYKDSDFHQPNKMTMKKKKEMLFTWFFLTILQIGGRGIPLHYFQFLHIAESVLRNVSQWILW